jgi:hypothetical protein
MHARPTSAALVIEAEGLREVALAQCPEKSMATLSESTLGAQTQLVATVERTLSALRSGLRQCESVATATKGDSLDEPRFISKVVQYSLVPSEMKNILTTEEVWSANNPSGLKCGRIRRWPGCEDAERPCILERMLNRVSRGRAGMGGAFTTVDGLTRAGAQAFLTHRLLRCQLRAAIASPMGTESSQPRSSVGCITNIDLSEWPRDSRARFVPAATISAEDTSLPRPTDAQRYRRREVVRRTLAKH